MSTGTLHLHFLPRDARGRPGKTVLDALSHLRLVEDIENNEETNYHSSSESELYQDDDDGGGNSSEREEENEKKGIKRVPWNETVPELLGEKRSGRIIERGAERKTKAQPVVDKNTAPIVAVRSSRTLPPEEVVPIRFEEWITREAIVKLYSKTTTATGTPDHNLSPPLSTASTSDYEAKVDAFFAGEEPNKKQEEETAALPPDEQVRV